MARKKDYFPYILIAPSVIIIAIVILYPFFYALNLSLHDFSPRRPYIYDFVGIGNYIRLLTSPHILTSLANTVIFTLSVLIGIIINGLLIAIFLMRSFKGNAFLRTLLLIPWAVPGIVNGVIWQWIFATNGVLNGIFRTLFSHYTYQPWLSSPVFAMIAIIYAEVWQRTPVAALLFMTGLSTIPREIYESARADGANTWSIFRRITLPLLRPTMTLVVVIQTIFILRAFDVIYVITGGGPADSTSVLSWLCYVIPFRQLDFGLGSALAFILTFISLISTVIYVWIVYRKIEY